MPCTFGVQDSSVGIDARYGLYDPGIELRWGRREGPREPLSLLYGG